VEAADTGRIVWERTVPQAPRDRLLDHLRLVDIVERRRHCLARRIAVNAHRLYLPQDTGSAVTADHPIVSSTRAGGAAVVDGAGPPQVGERLVDHAVGKSFAAKPVAELKRREFTTSEEE
jgi:hypothetical protein